MIANQAFWQIVTKAAGAVLVCLIFLAIRQMTKRPQTRTDPALPWAPGEFEQQAAQSRNQPAVAFVERVALAEAREEVLERLRHEVVRRKTNGVPGLLSEWLKGQTKISDRDLIPMDEVVDAIFSLYQGEEGVRFLIKEGLENWLIEDIRDAFPQRWLAIRNELMARLRKSARGEAERGREERIAALKERIKNVEDEIFWVQKTNPPNRDARIAALTAELTALRKELLELTR